MPNCLIKHKKSINYILLANYILFQVPTVYIVDSVAHIKCIFDGLILFFTRELLLYVVIIFFHRNRNLVF